MLAPPINQNCYGLIDSTMAKASYLDVVSFGRFYLFIIYSIFYLFNFLSYTTYPTAYRVQCTSVFPVLVQQNEYILTSLMSEQ